MNGDSYRGSSSGGGVINRSGAGGSSHRSAEENFGAYGSVSSNGNNRNQRSSKSGKSGSFFKRTGKFMIKFLAVVALIIGIIFGGFLVWGKIKDNNTAIDSSRYQVVFLTNGQFYFGKLSAMNSNYMKLTNVYYIKTDDTTDSTDTTSETTTEDTNYLLTKISDDVHNPDDIMIIAQNQILYYENIQSDSKITQLIDSQN